MQKVIEGELAPVLHGDELISDIFEKARVKLRRLARVPKMKKDIIMDIAGRLERSTHIPVAQISAEIARQLDGFISPRFVRKCLPEKYKQAYRAENAKAQTRTKRPPAGLAARVPLNQKLLLLFRKKQLEVVLNYSTNPDFAFAFAKVVPEGEHLAIQVVSPAADMPEEEKIDFDLAVARSMPHNEPATIRRGEAT